MSRKALNRLLLTLVLGVLAVGCATYTMSRMERTAAYNKFIETEKLDSQKSITAFRFHGWSSLGDEHLIITTRINRYYLVTLTHRCDELDFAHAIRINNQGSTLHAKFDSISVPGNNGIKCYIKSIHRISKDQRQQLWDIGKEKSEVEEKKGQENKSA